MKKLFPIALMVLGVVFIAAGGYTIVRGFDAGDKVRDELKAQKIVLTPDAAELVKGAVPGKAVTNATTAEQMAEVINHHALTSTGGLTYAEMGRFANKEGTPVGTNDEAAAAKDANGKPISNNLRNTALTAANLRTSLYTSVMAFNVADLVKGLGLMIIVMGLAVGGLGFALAGLAIPSLARKVHVDPIAAHA